MCCFLHIPRGGGGRTSVTAPGYPLLALAHALCLVALNFEAGELFSRKCRCLCLILYVSRRLQGSRG